jgi:hypothetical protein
MAMTATAYADPPPAANAGQGSLDVPVYKVPDLDQALIAQLEKQDQQQGLAPRYAVENDVDLTPNNSGLWEQVSESTVRWRLRVVCGNAVSLNFGFTNYAMPEGGQMRIYDTDGPRSIRPFTAADNEAHGQLWTPPLVGNDVIIDVTVPFKAQDQLDLRLTRINAGYKDFGHMPGIESGSCNVDVVCPEGDDWRAEIASVGVISTGGSRFCTGFMVNNTANDQTPFFMTANHCGISGSNAASLVVFWNYETSTCGGTPDGSLSDWQSGSFFRAGRSTSDFTLVELDDDPNPLWMVSFAGWDATGADANWACGIHHPNVDEKRISFEWDPTTTTSYLGNSVPGDGSHVRITDWDVGTTEPGSSGSPVFNQDHHVIGQLHGGYAACGNDDSDWYGKFSMSWNAGSSASSRLVDWLDPGSTGNLAVDTLWAGASGIMVTPSGTFTAEGPSGGPFTPGYQVYTIRNVESTLALDYTVTTSANWLDITNGSGTIPAGGTADVTVTINANANSFGNGAHNATVDFVNTTTHDGDATRQVALFVGVPEVAYSWDMSTDPGWTAVSQWAWGTPTGGGGQYGNNDPTSGHTGSNVYGYNLSGDYDNYLSERHLTTTAIDCSDLGRTTLKFWRYLNVEQPAYDHAYVRVSTNGTTWTDLWTNGSEITDNSWSQVEYDISAIADGQSTVYIRWTMGTTDGSWQYSGWNIDDVEIWGVLPDDCPPDFNGDGSVDSQDFIAFLNAFTAGDPSADFNNDGSVDSQDFIAFLNAFVAGC